MKISKGTTRILRGLSVILIVAVNLFGGEPSERVLLLSAAFFAFLSRSLEGISAYQKGQNKLITAETAVCVFTTLICLYGMLFRPWEGG